MNNFNKTVGQIVTEDYRIASIFDSHGIDFCYNGDMAIEEVLERDGINEIQLFNEINNLQKNSVTQGINFDVWPLELLANYIRDTHHKYVEKTTPLIQQYLDKICKIHGKFHPELFQIKLLFEQSARVLTVQMKKEELLLFPTIKRVSHRLKNSHHLEFQKSNAIENVIQLMKAEYDVEREIFKVIAELSNYYHPPVDACNSFIITYSLLKEFEADLHLHIHLENNLLFPKAIKLEKELTI
jgi:regulator of cell morphogenesis and NO signaling